jgi:hypothetical protein
MITKREVFASETGLPASGATPAFIVTSSRPRVGKTLVARALTEYFCTQHRLAQAFDVNPGDFKLIDYLPAYAAAASLDDTNGEMALFDQLIATDCLPKVVDLGHVVFERFFSVMQQIDLLVEAQRRRVAPMVLFITDADPRSLQGYAMLRDRFPGLPLVAVFNEHLPHLVRYRDKFAPTRHGGEPILIPTFTPVLRSVIDRPGFSLLAYAAKTKDPTTELNQWMQRVFITFRELEVRLLLGKAASQLRRSA